MSHGHDPQPTGTPPAHAEGAVPPVPTAGASEEAEHALHHSHHPFDRQVAMTMVVIAALLAGVKVLGHRAHNDTLSRQIESGRKQTESTDKWAEYQSQKLREHLYKSQAEQLVATKPEIKTQLEAKMPPKDKAPEKAKDGEGKKGRDSRSGIGNWAKVNPESLPEDSSERLVASWSAEVERYQDQSKKIMEKAKELGNEALELSEQSEKVHHQTFYYDLGELFIELSLVLSSVAILTKRPPFWYGGMAVGALGVVIALMGLFAH
jgi:hypothetical protein